MCLGTEGSPTLINDEQEWDAYKKSLEERTARYADHWWHFHHPIKSYPLLVRTHHTEHPEKFLRENPRNRCFSHAFVYVDDALRLLVASCKGGHGPVLPIISQ